jgi:hypothetical protein
MGISGVVDVPVAVGGTVTVRAGVEDGIDSLGRMVPTGVGDAASMAPQAAVKQVRIRPQTSTVRERFFIEMFLHKAGIPGYPS